MNLTTLRGAAAMIATVAGLSAPLAPALAQESTNVIGSEGDWTAFAGDSPKECWAVTPPTKSVNTRDGKPAEVTRGDIRLYVAYRPGAAGEVSFTGGYPFKPGSTVSADIGGQKFTLFTDGESAWTGSASEDAKLVGALRSGSSATFTAQSARGTQTVDTFSLSGVTKMTDLAKSRCQ